MSTLAGTTAMMRLILRRDRFRLPVWIAVVAVVTTITAATFARMFGTAVARQLLAGGAATNPALLAMVGPMFDATSTGGLTAWRLGALGAVLVALMSLLTVVRHTRTEEEAGRTELLGSTAIGRHAVLAASIAVAVGANLALALGVAIGLIAVGLPATGAAALGLSFAMAGATFAAVAAVASQLVATARAARGIAAALLGLSYLLRAAGDASDVAALSWSSPIGWAQRVRAFAGERWEVFALAAVPIGALISCAFALSSRRDLGAGILPPRLGPETAAPRLRSPIALAWRLQRGGLLGWTIAFAVIGTALGSLARSVPDILRGNLRLQAMVAAIGGHGDFVAAFFSATLGILGVLASVVAVQAVLWLRFEEETGRAELLLATGVGRLRWAASHLVFAAVGPAIALGAAGVAAGLVHGLAAGRVAQDLPPVLAGALVQVPAVWVVAGIAMALFGLAPRRVAAIWAVLVTFFLVGQLGQLLGLPAWAAALSPFTHISKLPGSETSPTSLLGLGAAAATLVIAGLIAFRRRDAGA